MLPGARAEGSEGACSDGGNGEVLDSAKVNDIFTQRREIAQLLEIAR
jgi:hypothetical protein